MCVNMRNFSKAKAAIVALAFIMVMSVGLGATIALAPGDKTAQRDNSACLGDANAKIAAAKSYAAAGNVMKDRIALACLIEATDALATELQLLSKATSGPKGQLHAPKGFQLIQPQERFAN